MANHEVYIDGVEYIPKRDSPDQPDPGLPPGYVSPHFKQAEFACNHCGELSDPGEPPAPDAELLAVLERTRKYFGDRPVTVNSAYRCKVHNDNVGSTDRSQHRTSPCTAGDIAVRGVAADAVYLYLDETYPHKYGIGRYPTFTHIDVRPNRARW